ncbi:MAG: hypothetical protein DRJ69_01430, partial [Thermoprotei archaeon]
MGTPGCQGLRGAVGLKILRLLSTGVVHPKEGRWLTVVVKVGGDLVRDEGPLLRVLGDVSELSRRDKKVVVVHGGGDIVTEVATKLGKEQVFVTSPEGFRSRYTDRETAEIYSMVMSGLINKRLVVSLQRLGVKALGLSGLDAGLLRAERKKR